MIISLFLLLAPAVLGAGTVPSNSDVVGYWKFEDLVDSSSTIGSWSNTGATSGSTGIIDDAYDFDGINDYMSISDSTDWDLGNTGFVCFWLQFDSVTDNDNIFVKNGAGNNNGDTGITINDNPGYNAIRFWFEDGSNVEYLYSSSVPPIDGSWTHVCFGLDSSYYSHLYIDGSLDDSSSSAFSSGSNFLGVSYDALLANEDFEGRIDEMVISSEAITTDIVTFLYDSGSPGSDQQYPFTTTTTTYNLSFYADKTSFQNYTVTLENGTSFNSNNTAQLITNINVSETLNFTIISDNHFSLSVTDYFYNSSVDEDYHFNLSHWHLVEAKSKYNGSYIPFNATIDGNSYSSSNGTLYIPLNGSVSYNITNNNYFGKSGSYTTSDNLTVYLWQSYITFDAAEILTGNALNGVTFNVSDNTSTPMPLPSGSYNVTASKAGYFDRTIEFNVSPLDNKTVSVTEMSDTIINLTAIEPYSGNSINNFSGWLYHPTTGTNITFSTDTGYYEIPSAQDENFTLQANSPGSYTTQTETLSPNASVYNYTINMYVYNSILISYYDELTQELINDATVELDLISDVYSNNYSTTNGTMYITLLSPASYTLRYSATDHYERLYYVNMVADTSFNLSLYLLNTSSGATNVTIEIVDQTAAPLDGAIVKTQRYDLTSNSYNTIGMKTTNSEGEAREQLILDSEFYRFVVSYNSQTLKTTSPQIITSTAIRIPVIIGETDLEFYNTYQSLDYNLYFQEASNSFVATFNDANNILSTVCLNTYRQHWAGDVLLNTTCEAGNVGTITHPASNVSGTTYYSVLSSTLSGEEIVLEKETYTYKDAESGFGTQGILIQLLLTLLVALVGLITIELLPPAIILSIIIGGLIGLHSIGLLYTVPLLIASLILTFLLSKNG